MCIYVRARTALGLLWPVQQDIVSGPRTPHLELRGSGHAVALLGNKGQLQEANTSFDIRWGLLASNRHGLPRRLLKGCIDSEFQPEPIPVSYASPSALSHNLLHGCSKLGLAEGLYV